MTLTQAEPTAATERAVRRLGRVAARLAEDVEQFLELVAPGREVVGRRRRRPGGAG